jgi:hypothetical protein
MAVPSSSRRSAAFDNGIGVCAEQFDSERFKTSGDICIILVAPALNIKIITAIP